jgi:hypothetical protein
MTSIPNSKYSFPPQFEVQTIYKGRRYKAFLLSKENPYLDYVDGFVVWDGLYDAAVAEGKCSDDGVYSGELLFSHVTIEVPSANSLRDFVENAKREQERFFKDSGI